MRTMFDSTKVPHGTRGGWTNHGCRCEACRVAERTYQRAWYARNPTARRKRQVRAKALRLGRDFGITTQAYEAQYNAQRGLCGICGKPPRPGRLSLAIDHDHKTGLIRGLLCDNCNLAIGNMKDDPNLLRTAAAYLERSIR